MTRNARVMRFRPVEIDLMIELVEAEIDALQYGIQKISKESDAGFVQAVKILEEETERKKLFPLWRLREKLEHPPDAEIK